MTLEKTRVFARIRIGCDPWLSIRLIWFHHGWLDLISEKCKNIYSIRMLSSSFSVTRGLNSSIKVSTEIWFFAQRHSHENQRQFFNPKSSSESISVEKYIVSFEQSQLSKLYPYATTVLISSIKVTIEIFVLVMETMSQISYVLILASETS